MDNARRWFCLVVCLGVLANLSFTALAVFLAPACLLSILGLGGVESTVWLYNYSILLALLSLFYLPAAFDPLRYRANAWLLVACRLVPATTFFMGVLGGFMAEGFVTLGIADASFGLVQLALWLRILALEKARSEAWREAGLVGAEA